MCLNSTGKAVKIQAASGTFPVKRRLSLDFTQKGDQRMRIKVILFVLMATALVLSACGPATINQAAPIPVRTLSVTGLGQVDLAPDIAYIYIGVHSEAESAAKAVAANKIQTTALISAIKKSGVDGKDIRTTNFSIWPSQQYDPKNVITGTIYMVDNTVYVTVRALDSLGDLLDAAIAAGANNVNSIQFDVADKTEALKEARAKAVKNAKEQAQELADTAGVKLGDIQAINFNESTTYPVDYGKGGGGGYAAEAAVPIQPGQLTLSVNVSLTFEIK
jgi:uncharacterized protein YggE